MINDIYLCVPIAHCKPGVALELQGLTDQVIKDVKSFILQVGVTGTKVCQQREIRRNKKSIQDIFHYTRIRNKFYATVKDQKEGYYV